MANTAEIKIPEMTENFEDLLNEQFGGKGIVGTVMKGTIIRLTDDFSTVDVGLKSEGRIPLREFGKNDELKVGDVVEVLVDRYEDKDGNIVLSREKARREEVWQDLEKMMNNNERVNGVIFGRVKGGFTVDLNVAIAFLPGSQIDIRSIKDITPLMGISQPFQILKMDKVRGNIVVSRRVVLEETRAEARAELIDTLKEGSILEGVVKNITDYGAFIELEDGIEGHVHVSEMSWTRKNVHPGKIVSTSQEVEVKVLEVDPEKRRISLGIKQLSENNIAMTLDSLKKGDIVKAVVTGADEKGVQVTVQGIAATIKKADLSKENNDPMSYKEGDVLEAKLTSVDRKNAKLGVSVKAYEIEEEKKALEEYSGANTSSGSALGEALGAALKNKE